MAEGVSVAERARRYVEKMEPSVSGQGGHTAAIKAATALVMGFDLPQEEAYRLFCECFNARCAPPWSEKEIRHKLHQAEQCQHGGRGYLLGAGAQHEERRRRPALAPVPRPRKRQDYDPEALKKMQRSDLKVTRGFLRARSAVDPSGLSSGGFLNELLEPGEKCLVFTSQMSQGDFGFEAGEHGRSFALGQRPGVAATPAPLPDRGREGVWFLPQPVDGKWHQAGTDRDGQPKLSRRSGKSVQAFRFLVLESDEAPEDLWLNLLVQLPLPIAALYTSGSRSVHALLQINASSKAVFDAFRDQVSPLLSKLGADPKAITGVRLTRLPGVMREGTFKGGKFQRFQKPGRQELLYLNPRPAAEPLMFAPLYRIDE